MRCSLLVSAVPKKVHGLGDRARIPRQMTTIGPNSKPENLTFSAAPQAIATATRRRIVAHRPSIHSDAISHSMSSASGTSFFTSAEWARKFGSRQKSVVAAMAGIAPANFQVHHASKSPSAAPTMTNMNRERLT